MANFKTLPIPQIVRRRQVFDGEWKMNWKQCERKESWPNLGHCPVFVWRDWGKPRNVQPE